MKPPDHPVPSGDRLIARLFMALLGKLGFEVELVSRLSTRCEAPDALRLKLDLAEAELASCLEGERGRPDRAAVVFTYHNYYRAPDLIGPGLSKALGLPYVLAESSRAPRRADGPWAEGHRLAEIASDAAALILAPTAHDMLMLEKLKAASQTVLHLRPFIDLAEWPLAGSGESPAAEGPVRLLAVGMMRPGNKVRSYLALAAILDRLADKDWTLDIVGDGDGRGEVEARFASLGRRVTFHGAFDDRARMSGLFRSVGIFVWPAVDEPIGMVFLEAQAHGLPCIAYGYRGVPDVIADARAGYVVPPEDEDLFVARLSAMIADQTLVKNLGRSARAMIERDHRLEAAAATVARAFGLAGVPLPPARFTR